MEWQAAGSENCYKPFMKYLLIMSPLLLLGCARFKTKEIIWTDGKPAYAMVCHASMVRCYEWATYRCPQGYDVVNKETVGYTDEAHGFRFAVNASGGGLKDVIFRCKIPEVAAK